jgi:hypothetical protein
MSRLRQGDTARRSAHVMSLQRRPAHSLTSPGPAVVRLEIPLEEAQRELADPLRNNPHRRPLPPPLERPGEGLLGNVQSVVPVAGDEVRKSDHPVIVLPTESSNRFEPLTRHLLYTLGSPVALRRDSETSKESP